LEKYIRTFKELSKRYGSVWIAPAVDAVIEVALQDFLKGGITQEDYSEVCHLAADLKYPRKM
jgi:hypothetical protein